MIKGGRLTENWPRAVPALAARVGRKTDMGITIRTLLGVQFGWLLAS